MKDLKIIEGRIRKAVQDYNMISEGDSVLVGVSGGKDSLSLLYGLSSLQKYYEKKFILEAVTLKPERNQDELPLIKKICDDLSIKHHTIETDIKTIVFDIRKEKNPCSMCANLRRGALYTYASENNFQRVALGHHMDDVNETLLLSLFYEGRLNTFSPVTYLERRKIYSIRPLIYLSEKEITEFIKKNNIRTQKSNCPVDGDSKRQEIKEMLNEMSKSRRDIKNTIFGAIKKSNLDGWEKPEYYEKEL
jgi:tRNA 2-thiocytidine biosynthesis protein TtcA